MKTIFVTGGCGFVGSHICLNLLESGYSLIVLDSNVNSSIYSLNRIIEIGRSYNKDFKDKISFVKGDIRNKNLLNEIFTKSNKDKKKIEGVVHCAGLKSVHKSCIDPVSYWDVNVRGAIGLFDVMESNNCQTIVFSSSATVYGNTNKEFLNETLEINPVNPYGETKASVENILKSIYLKNKKWRIANLRYFNPIGANPTGMIGEDSLSISDNLFPQLCQVALGGKEKLNIYGKNWRTVDGTCVRDYIHISDLANAHQEAIGYLLNQDSKYINLNVGTGKGTTVLELIETFQKANNCNIKFQFVSRRNGDVRRLVADNKLIISTLNWAPCYNLFDMCIDEWRWRKKNPNGYQKINNIGSQIKINNFFSD